MMASKSENERAVNKVFSGLGWAFWEGIIEAGKVNFVAAFGLGFYKSLQETLHAQSPEELAELARAVHAAEFDEIKAALAKQRIAIEQQQIVLARIFSGIAEYSELKNGVAPTEVELLNVLSRIETLPDEILDIVRTQLAEVRGEIRILPERIIEEERVEAEHKRKTAHEEFEREYLKAIKQEYGYMELMGIPSYHQWHPINAGFVSLSLQGASFQRLSAESVLREHPRLIIVGEAGAGKTTLMQWEAFRCCDGLEDDLTRECDKSRGGMRPDKRDTSSGKIPFFIRLRRLVEKDQDYLAFPPPNRWIELSTKYLVATTPPDWLNSVLRDGRALLILDGLDELPPNKRPEFWKELQACLRQHTNLCFRVTSRPFPHEEDKADQWQPPLELATNDPTPQVNVLELSPDRIFDLIDQWHRAAVEGEPTPDFRDRTEHELEGYADRLKEKLGSSQYAKLFDLAKTPFFCAAICLINRHRRELLPKRRHELYKTLVEALLGLRDKGRGIISAKEYNDLDVDVEIRLHAWLALEMMTSGMTAEKDDGDYLIEVSRDDAAVWLGSYIRKVPALLDAVNIKGEKKAAQDLIDYMLTRCGLLREPVKGQLDFRHRALQEYLAGSGAIIFKKRGQLINMAHDDRWRDTIILAAGGYQTSDPEALDLINELITRGKDEDETICYAIAVASIETAGAKVDMETLDRALEKLGQLVPPHNTQEARVLSVAGDRVVELLPYETMSGEGVETLAACAETLRQIGSEAAKKQLKQGYWEDEHPAVLEQVVQCPGIHPLDIPAVVEAAKDTQQLTLPRYAHPYLKNIDPIKNLPDLIGLDLADCGALTDLAGLESLTKLRTLDLSRCPCVTDLSPLVALTTLESLSVRCCEKIPDLAPLRQLTALKTLDLANCTGIEDFSPLDDLVNLRAVDLQGCRTATYPEIIITECKSVQPDSNYIETIDGLNLRMIWIPAGTFRMGGDGYDDEKPVHEVTLDGFWLGQYPITQAQYEAVMKTNPSNLKGERLPVECVSWEDAVRFCEVISQRTGRNYMLPSEAQWEYGCRAGSTGKYCFGDSELELREYAWYSENSGGQTHPAGMLKSNAWKVYDMHGNVWEWCADWFDGNYYSSSPRVNPRGPESGRSRVRRGGSWCITPGHCRAAFRGNYSPDDRLINLGFRVLAVPAAG
ncbi:MAG TPA: SUMF1/EgtB/PvdO family nonheme iron enzyme [Candidatus Hydrogenedentes bacterium]|nr:SUMF1/EgtB/PvdO family nonheme iron enzyme [Candidatus Hydrogenedentota bacterium]